MAVNLQVRAPFFLASGLISRWAMESTIPSAGTDEPKQPRIETSIWDVPQIEERHDAAAYSGDQSAVVTTSATKTVTQPQKSFRPTMYPQMIKTPNSWPSLSHTSYGAYWSQASPYSPVEHAHCVALGIHYIRWIVPGLTSEQVIHTLKAWTPAKDERLHQAAICLASIAHIRELQPSALGELHVIFKAEVLRGVQRLLNDPDNAISLSTIGALMHLINFEVALNSPEARLHLIGLASILRKRGGLEYQGFGGGVRKYVEWVDLLWAVKNGEFPIYTASVLVVLSPEEETDARRTEIRKIDGPDPPGEFSRPSVAWHWKRKKAKVFDADYYERDTMKYGLYTGKDND